MPLTVLHAKKFTLRIFEDNCYLVVKTAKREREKVLDNAHSYFTSLEMVTQKLQAGIETLTM
jgi:hypothetical protein